MKEWLVPFKTDGKKLIEKIQYLEFLENKNRYRRDEDAINGVLGDEI